MRYFTAAAVLLLALTASCGGNFKVTVDPTASTLSAADVTRVSNEVCDAVRDIRNYLGMDKKIPDIEISFVQDGPSGCTIDGKFSVVEDFARLKWSPVYYDTMMFLDIYGENYRRDGRTRLGSRFFSEGLAMMFQQLFGEDKQFPFYDLDFDASMKEYAKEFFPFADILTNAAVFDDFNTRERAVAYTEACSFLLYLNYKYGPQKIGEIYWSDGPDFEGVLGKTMDELEKEWKAYYNLS